MSLKDYSLKKTLLSIILILLFQQVHSDEVVVMSDFSQGENSNLSFLEKNGSKITDLPFFIRTAIPRISADGRLYFFNPQNSSVVIINKKSFDEIKIEDMYPESGILDKVYILGSNFDLLISIPRKKWIAFIETGSMKSKVIDLNLPDADIYPNPVFLLGNIGVFRARNTKSEQENIIIYDIKKNYIIKRIDNATFINYSDKKIYFKTGERTWFVPGDQICTLNVDSLSAKPKPVPFKVDLSLNDEIRFVNDEFILAANFDDQIFYMKYHKSKERIYYYRDKQYVVTVFKGFVDRSLLPNIQKYYETEMKRRTSVD